MIIFGDVYSYTSRIQACHQPIHTIGGSKILFLQAYYVMNFEKQTTVLAYQTNCVSWHYFTLKLQICMVLECSCCSLSLPCPLPLPFSLPPSLDNLCIMKCELIGFWGLRVRHPSRVSGVSFTLRVIILCVIILWRLIILQMLDWLIM